MAEKDLKILIVDDYMTMVRIMRKLLKQCGYETVEEATNGQEALEKIQNNSFDLIISDWNMEPMTGFELLKVVRATERTAKLPFILVTAEAKPENIEAAKTAGANQYLVKPFSAPILKERIAEAIAAA